MLRQMNSLEIESERARRASAHQAVTLISGSQYLVAGTRGSYYVQIRPLILCHCKDAVLNPERACKHMIAAMMHAKDPRVSHLGAPDPWPAHKLHENDRRQIRRPLEAELQRFENTPQEVHPGKILSHPELGLTQIRRFAKVLLQIRDAEDYWILLSRSEVAAHDPIVQRLAAAADVESYVHAAFIHHAQGEDFRALFKRLVEDENPLVLDVLQDEHWAAHLTHLVRRDLIPLMRSDRPEEHRRVARAAMVRIEAGDPDETIPAASFSHV